MQSDFLVFCFDEDKWYANQLEAQGLPIVYPEEHVFEGGEYKTRAMQNVEKKDVYIVQSLYGDEDLSINDKLCRLLLFVHSLRNAGVNSITVVAPYLCYSRIDRKKTQNDPVSTKAVAELLEAMGIDMVVSMDIHNLSVFHNSYRCRTENMEAHSIFATYLSNELKGQKVVVMSPDIGGVKRAELFREVLEEKLSAKIDIAFIEKKRNHNEISGDPCVYGDVDSATVIIYDDMMTTGATMMRAAKACRDAGASAIYGVATHGLFVGKVSEILQPQIFAKIIITDSVRPLYMTEEINQKLVTLKSASLVSDTIKKLHQIP